MVDGRTDQGRTRPIARWGNGRRRSLVRLFLAMALAMAFVAGCGVVPARAQASNCCC